MTRRFRSIKALSLAKRPGKIRMIGLRKSCWPSKPCRSKENTRPLFSKRKKT